MTTISKYVKLKEQVDEAKSDADKAEGALNQIMKQLKTDFDCSSLTTAEKKCKQLKKQAKEAEENFDNAVEEFTEKWVEELQEDDL